MSDRKNKSWRGRRGGFGQSLSRSCEDNWRSGHHDPSVAHSSDAVDASQERVFKERRERFADKGNRSHNPPHQHSSHNQASAEPLFHSLSEGRGSQGRAFEQRQERFADKFNYVSRTDGPASYDLKDRKYQQELYSNIQIQDLKTENDYQYVMTSYRKLREGILASQDYDDFAVQVYEKSVDHCLLALSHSESESHFFYSELLKSLAVLHSTLYPSVKDTSQRRAEMTKYYMLYLMSSKSRFLDVMQVYHAPLSPSLKYRHADILFAWNLFKCLLHVNYVQFTLLWHQSNASDRIFLKLLLPTYRQSTMALFQKSFFTYPLDKLQTFLLFENKQETLDYLSAQGISNEQEGEICNVLLKKKRTG